MNLGLVLLLFSFFIYAPTGQSAYYDVLPQGRFNFQFRWIKTNSIVNSFDSSGGIKTNDVQFNLDGKTIYGANEILDKYFDDLSDINPAAFDQFQIGSYEIKPKANVNVRVFGFGYGLGKKSTVYLGIPFYQAEVNVEFNRTKGNNYDEIVEIVGEDEVSTVTQITRGLPDITEGIIQTVLIDYFGVLPIGTWRAEGPGDIEAGVMHQVYSSQSGGGLLKFGVILPTGKIENPDILQDISFGDGQVDTFVEAGFGLQLAPFLEFNNSLRFTYQFDSQKTRRVPDISGTSLGVDKIQVTEKLGNKIDVYSNLSYSLLNLFRLEVGHYYYFQGATKYLDNNSSLFNFSDFRPMNSHAGEIKFVFTTVNRYLQNGQFFLPFELSASYFKTLKGENIQAINRTTLQFSTFF